MGLLDSLLNVFKQSGGSVLNSVTNQAKTAVNRAVANKTSEVITKATTKAAQPKKPDAAKAQPAPAASANGEYMLKERGTEIGPYTKDQIDIMIKAGRLNADSPVKKAGMDYWGTLYELDEFTGQFD